MQILIVSNFATNVFAGQAREIWSSIWQFNTQCNKKTPIKLTEV